MNHPHQPVAYHTIFITFLKLGCLSFGGPAAHLVFFQQKFVQQLKWLDEQQYSQLLALAQILPGPTSSQMGIAIGYVSKGYAGAVCAWLGFTLPSAILMTLAAILGLHLSPYLSSHFFHVIQLIVLAVVTWAFWQMLRSFCSQRWQYVLMIGAALFIYFVQLPFNQMLVILIAGVIGIVAAQFLKNQDQDKVAIQKALQISQVTTQQKTAYLWLCLFFLPFLVIPLLKIVYPGIFIESFEGLYRAASLVFGGGHIILPLLHQDFVATGLISNEKFDLGYAVAQLMPGPLFSFASYIGALLPLTDSRLINSAIATVVIFIPSFLLIFGTLPYWSWFLNQRKIYQAIAGINAAVVGLLLCLVIQMAQKYIVQWPDLLFMIWVVALLRTKLPVWITLIGSFCLYYGILYVVSF